MDLCRATAAGYVASRKFVISELSGREGQTGEEHSGKECLERIVLIVWFYNLLYDTNHHPI